MNSEQPSLSLIRIFRANSDVSALCAKICMAQERRSLQLSPFLLISKRRSMQTGSTMPIIHLYIASREA
jgi:hypothetical protein